MTRAIALTALIFGFLTSLPVAARAQIAVGLELALAVDTSSSVNQGEYDLQMRGIAQAFRSPDVINLIAHAGGVAVTLIQWSSRADLRSALPWRLLNNRQSVLAFAAEVEAMPRARVGILTGIGSAIVASLRALETNQFAGTLRRIDISGDGQSNAGLPLERARNLASAMDVTINGLAIETDVPNLASYYRDHIITGPGAFVIAAGDYVDFARAMQAKLLRELQPGISWNVVPPTKNAAVR